MKQQPELKIYEVETASLVPYANNAKTHGNGDVESLVASIEEFGFCDPIGIWHNAQGEAEIVEGHGRVLALEKLGIKMAPVIFLDHLTDEQRRAYTHVHNQTTMNSGFDLDILDGEFQSLGFDWESFGFDAGEPLDLSYFDTDILNKPKNDGGGSTIQCPNCGEEIEL